MPKRYKPKELSCVICGSKFMTQGTHAKYCPECSYQRNKELQKERMRRHKAGKAKTMRKPSICWSCRNAVPEVVDGIQYGCSWSMDAKPIPGWTAEESKYLVDSWRVWECPQFLPEEKEAKK